MCCRMILIEVRVSNDRNIFTYNKNLKQGVKFKWNKISLNAKNDLKTNHNGSQSTNSKGKERLEYLRGDRDNEEKNNGTFKFRDRTSILGDIIHSSPVFVGAPKNKFPISILFPNSTKYDNFKALAKNREKVVYVGSNDGMLHAFKASNGKELMGYIPEYLFNSDINSGLHFLTDPDYTHRYYTDLSPIVSDVYIDKGDSVDEDSDGSYKDWHSILIGGSRAGGAGIFALDVTDPDFFSETGGNAKKLALWEFSSKDDADMGLSYSKPVIAMMSNGRWAAIFGNGYSNKGSTKAKLFIVFIDGGVDGVWTKGVDYLSLDTNNTLNNGLSTINSFDINGDKVPDRIYAGDLDGNMWNFDVSDPDPGKWGIVNKGSKKPLFVAEHNGTRQAITSKPEVVRLSDTNLTEPKLLVLFGTGKFLETSDKSSNEVNSFYGVVDDNSSHNKNDLVEQTFLVTTYTNEGTNVEDIARVVSDNEVDYNNDSGWFIDFDLITDIGEKIIVDPTIVGDHVFFNTWVPNLGGICSSSSYGYLMSLKLLNGGGPEQVIFDFNGDNKLDHNDNLLDSVSKINFAAGEKFEHGLPSSSSFLSNKQYTSGTEGGNDISQRLILLNSGIYEGRYSWRELR